MRWLPPIAREVTHTYVGRSCGHEARRRTVTNVKAVIFDIDGTLIDSVDLHARSWVEAFAEFGHEVSFEQVRGQIGKGGDKLLPEFLSAHQIEADGKGLEERRAVIMKDRLVAQIKPFDDVRELFERLLRDGKAIALASSAKGDELQTYKRIARIENLPLVETSSDDADESKPAPDIFEAAMKCLGSISPEHVIAVGDTPYDAESAGKAGLRTVGVLCGGWPAEKLREAGCVEVYKDPADLLGKLSESMLA